MTSYFPSNQLQLFNIIHDDEELQLIHNPFQDEENIIDYKLFLLHYFYDKGIYTTSCAYVQTPLFSTSLAHVYTQVCVHDLHGFMAPYKVGSSFYKYVTTSNKRKWFLKVQDSNRVTKFCETL